MNAERLSARPCVLDEDIRGDIAYLPDNIQLA